MARHSPPINGEVLYQARMRLGLSQLQVAELTGKAGRRVADSNLSKFEHGKLRRGTPATRKVLRDVLGLTDKQMFAPCETCGGDWSATCLDHPASGQHAAPADGPAEETPERRKQPSAA